MPPSTARPTAPNSTMIISATSTMACPAWLFGCRKDLVDISDQDRCRSEDCMFTQANAERGQTGRWVVLPLQPDTDRCLVGWNLLAPGERKARGDEHARRVELVDRIAGVQIPIRV